MAERSQPAGPATGAHFFGDVGKDLLLLVEAAGGGRGGLRGRTAAVLPPRELCWRSLASMRARTLAVENSSSARAASALAASAAARLAAAAAVAAVATSAAARARERSSAASDDARARISRSSCRSRSR